MKTTLWLIVLLLSLILVKLDKYIKIQTNTNDEDYDNPNWLRRINRGIWEMTKKITPITDHYLSNNPAGLKSDKFKKKANLIKVYADYLVKTEKLPIKEARIRSCFEINTIYKHEEDKIKA